MLLSEDNLFSSKIVVLLYCSKYKKVNHALIFCFYGVLWRLKLYGEYVSHLTAMFYIINIFLSSTMEINPWRFNQITFNIANMINAWLYIYVGLRNVYISFRIIYDLEVLYVYFKYYMWRKRTFHQFKKKFLFLWCPCQRKKKFNNV